MDDFDSVTSAPPRPQPLDLVDQPPPDDDLIDDGSPLSCKEIGELIIKHDLRSPIPLACLPEELHDAFNELERQIYCITEDIYCPDREYEREQFFERGRFEIRWELKKKFGYGELEEAVDEAMEARLEDFEDDFDDFFSSLQEDYEIEITEKVEECLLRLKEEIEMHPIFVRVINGRGKPLIVTVCEEWSGEFDDDDYDYYDEGFFGNVRALRQATEFLFQCNPFVFQNSMEIKNSENQTYLHVLCEILTSDYEVIGEAIYSIVENHNPSSLMLCDGEGKTPLFVLCEKLHHWIDDEGRDADSCSQLLVLISTIMQRCPESTRVMTMEGSRALDKLMPHSNVPAVQDLIIFMNRCLYPLVPSVSDNSFTGEVQLVILEEARHVKIGARLNEMTSMLSKRTELSEDDGESPTSSSADEVCEALENWTKLQLSKINQNIEAIQDVDIPRIKKKYAA